MTIIINKYVDSDLDNYKISEIEFNVAISTPPKELLRAGIASEKFSILNPFPSKSHLIRGASTHRLIRSFFYLLTPFIPFLCPLMFLLLVTDSKSSFRALILFSLLSIITVVLHELGHVIALISCSPKDSFVLTTGKLGFSILRKRISPEKEIFIAAAGALPAVLISLILIFTPVIETFSALIWLILTSAQIIALVLPVGDGKNLIFNLLKLTAKHDKQ